MYEQGKGLPQDFTEAVAWYRKAADQGFARAQDDLGYMYLEGKGVWRDYSEAARWYRKAAKQGDEYALRALDSMNIRFTAPSKVMLSVTVLGCILFLISPWQNIRTRQRRRAALAGLLGLLWVGVDVYAHTQFGILLALSVVNPFYFGKGLLSGICVAMVLSTAWPQAFKMVLGICGILFIGFNTYAAMHFDLRNVAACLRAFYSTNALLIGLAITLTILLRLEVEEARAIQNGDDGVAPGIAGGSGTASNVAKS
jgi:hypothetical protein